MKLKKEQEKFDKLIKKLKEEEFKYIPREEKHIDWSKYDQAQINEMNDMLILIRNAVDEAALRQNVDEKYRKKGPGRPSNHPTDLAKAVLMQQYFCVSNRIAAGLVKLFREKLRLKDTFSYKSIERAYEEPLVTLLLKEIFRLTQEPVREKERVFSPDGTGVSTSTKQNWENDRRKGAQKKGYEKMIAMVGCTYKVFSAFEQTASPEDHESPYFGPLLAETNASYEQIDVVPGDSAYLSRQNCDFVARAGGVPRFYPKKGSTLKRRGSRAWAEMLFGFVHNTQSWLREYHPRSVSESAFSVFKRDFPVPIRKRLRLRRKQEIFARVCDYNLKRLCYLRYMEDISAVEVWHS